MTPRRAAVMAFVAVLGLPAAVVLEAAAFASTFGAALPCDATDAGCPPNAWTVVLFWSGIAVAAVAALTLIGVALWALRRAHQARGWAGLVSGLAIVLGGAGVVLIATGGLSRFCGSPTSLCVYPPSTVRAIGQVLVVGAIAAVLASVAWTRSVRRPPDGR